MLGVFPTCPDQAAPDPDQSVMDDGPAPSGLDVNPPSGVGHSGPLSGDSSSLVAPPAPPSLPPSTLPAPRKRARGDDNADDKDEEEKSASPSSSTTSVISTGSKPSSSVDTRHFRHVTVGRDKLAARANIDCRTKDTLKVSFRVSDDHPDQPPKVDFHNYNATQNAQLRIAIKLLESKTGFAMSCPKMPRYLLESGDVYMDRVEHLTPVQREWHDELTLIAERDFDAMRGEGVSPEADAEACLSLWRHLNPAVFGDSALFTEQYVTSSWVDVLRGVGTRIDSDGRSSPKAAPAFHSYQLVVKGTNPLVTHILACRFQTYGGLKTWSPALTAEWEQLKRGEDSEAGSNSTDASSGSDGEGFTQPKTAIRRDQQRRRRATTTANRIKAFTTKLMASPAAQRFSDDTGLPLLALSTTVRVRAWENRYTSALVSNFESIGCDVDDLETDPRYQAISTSIPALIRPYGAWVVNQHNGGATVTIFVREDLKDELVGLSGKLRARFPTTNPRLNVKVSLQETGSRGGDLRNRKLIPLYLEQYTETVVTKPQRAQRETVSTSPEHAPHNADRWLAAVHQGLQGKRLPENNTLDHRPKKKTDNHDNGTNKVQQPPPRQPSPQQQQPSQQQRPKNQPKNQQQHQQSTQPKPSQPTAPPQPAPVSSPTAPFDFKATAAWKELEAQNVEMKRQVENITAHMKSTTAQINSQLETITQRLQLTVENMTTEFSAKLKDTNDLLTKTIQDTATQNTQMHTMLSLITQRLQIEVPPSLVSLTSIPALPSMMMVDPAMVTLSNANYAAASPASNRQVVGHV